MTVKSGRSRNLSNALAKSRRIWSGWPLCGVLLQGRQWYQLFFHKISVSESRVGRPWFCCFGPNALWSFIWYVQCWLDKGVFPGDWSDLLDSIVSAGASSFATACRRLQGIPLGPVCMHAERNKEGDRQTDGRKDTWTDRELPVTTLVLLSLMRSSSGAGTSASTTAAPCNRRVSFFRLVMSADSH